MLALAIALSALAAADPAAPAAAAPPEPATAPAPVPVPDDDRPELRSYLVESVDVRGLEKARLYAVRGHLLVAAGDVLDDRDVLMSRLRLLQLGWFRQVEARVEKGSSRGLVVVVFNVVERNTILITDLVLGTTDAQPIYGGVGLSEQNFLGRGFTLAGAFVYGGAPLGRPADPDRFALRGSFFAPDVSIPGAGRFVAGASAWTMRGEEFACALPGCDPWIDDLANAPRLRYRRTGGDLTVGLRSGPFNRILASWRFDRISAEPLPAGPSSEFVPPPIHFGRSLASALVVTWERDTRDDFFLPREGYRVATQVAFASRLFGSDYEYSRYWLQVETGFGLTGLPLRFQLQAGAAQGDAPFFDRFYAADLSYFSIGPALGRALELNFSTDSRYDAFAAMGGLEWAVPIPIQGRFIQRAYLSIGARGVWSTAVLGGGRTRISSIPFSADLALRFDTPVGAFNASLGYALDNLL
jgi:outer membrane protein assembly factor BamA